VKKGKRVMRPVLSIVLIGYLLGLIGELWDWHQHLTGLNPSMAHLIVDIGMLLILAVLLLSIGPLRKAWRGTGGHRSGLWFIGAFAGGAILLLGILVDGWWHGAHPGVAEMNVLVLPGHQLELIGLMIGVVLVTVLLTRSRGQMLSQQQV